MCSSSSSSTVVYMVYIVHLGHLGHDHPDLALYGQQFVGIGLALESKWAKYALSFFQLNEGK